MSGFGGYLTATPGGLRAEALEAMLEPLRRGGGLEEGLCWIARGRDSVWSVRSPRGDGGVSRARLQTPPDADLFSFHDVALLHVPSALEDLGEEARQPYVAPEGDLVLVFDGEVFNQGEIRLELERRGTRLRSSTLIELLAAALRAWGESTWERLNGSWAAAVYRRDSRTLVLCRDRLGERPLYLSRQGKRLVFGTSVLGVARARPGGVSVNRSGVKGFIDTGMKDFDERTLFEGVYSAPSGTLLSYSVETGNSLEARAHRFWSFPTERWRERDITLPEATTFFRDSFRDAVACRLESKDRVAFQLSSGLDSSSVVALAADLEGGPLNTFTISIRERDEEPLTRVLEKRLPIVRRVLLGMERCLFERSEELALWMEEPVQAPGAYGHLLMCEEMGKAGFEVVLSGAGGDTTLAGEWWEYWPLARMALREEGHAVHAFLHDLALRYGSPARAADSLQGWIRWIGRIPGRGLSVLRGRRRGSKREESSRRTNGGARGEVYAGQLPSEASGLQSCLETQDYDARRRFAFRHAELPYYLVSNHRATSGVPILHRQPFLDHRLVELGLRMPVGYLFRTGWTKYVLRRAMDPLVPREILWRREKEGLSYHLPPLLEDHISQILPVVTRLREEGLLVEEEIQVRTLIRQDPLRLWRIWSVGCWIQALD